MQKVLVSVGHEVLYVPHLVKNGHQVFVFDLRAHLDSKLTLSIGFEGQNRLLPVIISERSVVSRAEQKIEGHRVANDVAIARLFKHAVIPERFGHRFQAQSDVIRLGKLKHLLGVESLQAVSRQTRAFKSRNVLLTCSINWAVVSIDGAFGNGHANFAMFNQLCDPMSPIQKFI